MTIDKALTVDLNRVQPHKVIKIHEGDTNSVFLMLTVTKDGEAVSLSGLTIKYDATIAGYLAEQDASGSVSSGKIRIPITKNMTALPGTLKIDIKMKSGTEVLYTQTVTMIVDKSVVDNSTIIDFDGTTIGGRLTALEGGFLDVKTLVRQLNAKFPIEADDIADNQVIKVKSITNDDATVNAAVENHIAYRVTLDGRSNLMFCVNSGTNLRSQYRFDTLGYIKYRTQTKDSSTGEWNAWSDWTPFASSQNIPNGAVSTSRISDGAVSTAKIADGAVTTDKLASNAVTAAKIATGAIHSQHLSAGAVDTDAIETSAVTSNEIANGAVTTDKLASKAVTGAKIGDKAVGTGQIALLAVTEGTLAVGAVTELKLADGAVTTDKIAATSVTTQKLAGGAVTTAKLSDSTVTANKIVSGAVTTAKLADNSVTSDKIADGAVTLDKIPNEEITADKLAPGSVTTSQIEYNAVTSDEIANGAITANKIATGAVTTSKIPDESIPTNKIENGAITTVKINGEAVTEGKIKDGAVSTDKLQSEAVTTAKIKNGAVTAAKIASGVIPTKTSDLTNDSGFVSDLSGCMKLAHTTTSEDAGQFYLERVGLSWSAVNLYLALYSSDPKRVAWYEDIPDVSGKADAATTLAGYGITDAYTKEQVDGLIPTVPTKTSELTNDSGFLTQHQDISGKADIESGTVPSNHAWYTQEGDGYTMTGNYTIIGNMCFLRATAYLIQGWERVYYSLPVAATASGSTLALHNDGTFTVATGTQSNISVLEIKQIGSQYMSTGGTISFTLVYKCS